MNERIRQRWNKFRANRRGFYAFIVFCVVLVLTSMADFIANDKPLVVRYDGSWYFPIFRQYPETVFGGEFKTAADFKDPYLQKKINEKGFFIMPLIEYSYDTINYNLPTPAPSAPTRENWLGTDDLGRDVLARLIYGMRYSLLFGLILTALSSAIGIFAGAVQGYFGGKIDLFAQRFLEIWGSLPQLFVLIIVSSLIVPGFWTLLFVLLLFSWTALVPVVRAEFLRARNFDYVRAAYALGVPHLTIIFRHVFPNAMVATLTYLPFILSGAVVSLTALDFLGFGLPPGSPSLGDLVRQGKENLQAPWLAASAFVSLAFLLTVLVFIGEAVRDAFDPRKNK
ncbi:MAG: ABC transporter permease [Alphaproteobacteria bacterium]|nr:ABC transporter permease [Alphaproteobacteria bacterium]MBO4643721.1 ABC transporter permease [Alphaproteobacteria bacterium]